MPRYFFIVQTFNAEINDQKGTLLKNDAEAVALAEGVLSYRGPHGQPHLMVTRAAMVDRTSASLPSGSRSMLAISISSPHRHAAPSVQPGSNKRSNDDIEPPPNSKNPI
jgi:hypothetical protein